MASAQSGDQDVGRAAIAIALAIGGAIILGGGGSPTPLPETTVQLLVASLTCLALAWAPDLLRGVTRDAYVLGALLLVCPAIQLVPLPPGLWQALPGRELQRSALALVGAENTWRPFTVSPPHTIAALLALVPPALLIVLVAAQRRNGRAMAIGMIAGVGLLAVPVGLLQITSSGNAFRLYSFDGGFFNGFQANHNSTADVFLIAMVAQAVLVTEWFGRHRPGRSPRITADLFILALVSLLSIAVFLTASRAGTALLPLAWGWIFAIVLHGRRRGPIPARRVATIAAAVTCLAAALATWAAFSGPGAKVLSRYDLTGEGRPQIWVGAIAAAAAYAPWGAGMGSFTPVFMATERLENVGPTLANRAHNDYLELAVEAGIAGYVILAVVIGFIGKNIARSLSGRSGVPFTHACFSAATFCIIAIHSLVDYPLRSMSLACIASAAAGVVLPLPHRATRGTQGTMKERV